MPKKNEQSANAKDSAMSEAMALAEQVARNQQSLSNDLRSTYDFIVCGSGPSGSVIAGRLAEHADVRVLLLEAGGTDDAPSVIHPAQWSLNFGGERDWSFQAQPNPYLNGRALGMSMGKVLGGGSSINGMVWAWGHKNDWELYADEAGDSVWSFASVLDLYRRIEDWHGPADARYRGTGGPVFVAPAANPSPLARAFVDGARLAGIPSFEAQNGRMMEGEGGASLFDLCIRDGRRASIFRAYAFPLMGGPNLTVLTGALVTRVLFEKKQASGVEFFHDGVLHRIAASREVVLSLGTFHTPKVLMQSGIGDQGELQELGIPIVQDLPGVGKNLQDHLGAASCIWEASSAPEPRNNGIEAVLFWKSSPERDTPDMQVVQGEFLLASAETLDRFHPPDASWILFPWLVRPKSRGRLRLTGPGPQDPMEIHANALQDPDDLRALVSAVELSREIGNSAAFRPFVRREVAPGPLNGPDLEKFVRDAALSVWHPSGTAKMGRDSLSVVDSRLRVHGIEHLRVADASILPRVPTGNTMAPCVVVGEIAAQSMLQEHGLSSIPTPPPIQG